MLLSVDPGLRKSGVAVFGDDEKLRFASLVTGSSSSDKMSTVDACQLMAKKIWDAVCDVTDRNAWGIRVIFEWPRVYRQGKREGDPNDLLPLVGVGLALVSRVQVMEAISVFPHEWKSSMSKELANARTLERLSAEEKKVMTRAAIKNHNVLDAVGIGLHQLGRFERKRVFPGASAV